MGLASHPDVLAETPGTHLNVFKLCSTVDNVKPILRAAMIWLLVLPLDVVAVVLTYREDLVWTIGAAVLACVLQLVLSVVLATSAHLLLSRQARSWAWPAPAALWLIWGFIAIWASLISFSILLMNTGWGFMILIIAGYGFSLAMPVVAVAVMVLAVLWAISVRRAHPARPHEH